MEKYLRNLVLILLLIGFNGFGQTATKIQIDAIASQSKFPVSVPFYVKLSARNNDNTVDTSYNNLITANFDNGSFNGANSVFFSKGIAEFKELIISDTGTFLITFSSDSLLTDSTSLKVGNKIGFSNSSSQIQFFPDLADSIPLGNSYFKYVLAVDSTGNIDTTNTDSVQLALNDIATVIATLTFNKGVAIFSNILIADTGNQNLISTSGTLLPDTFTLYVKLTSVNNTSNTTNCDSTEVGSRNNLGIYGGKCVDLTFSPVTKRLFAGALAPSSLYYSDDTAKTWIAAFPIDSLEYNCAMQGWGGGARQVLANNKGWVAAYTQEEGGSLRSTVISFQNGDSGSWKTASDEYIMFLSGYGQEFANGIALTDHYLYSIFTSVIVIQDSFGIKNIIDASLSISGWGQQSSIACIDAANSSSAYPLYFVVDTSGDVHNAFGKLYKYDGIALSEITLPAVLSSNGIRNVFVPQNSVNGDTLFISAAMADTPIVRIFRSYDGGNNWQDISWTNDNKQSLLSDIEYHSQLGNHAIILILSGKAVSKDLGSTWEALSSNDFHDASIFPNDTNCVVVNSNNGVQISKTGMVSNFEIADNFGLEAVQVMKIARTENKSVFYIATRSGLAYTTAYLDSSVKAFDKWHYPYGEFPIANINDSDGTWAIAIDPNDSLHVIAGGSDGFYVTQNGPSGFINIPTGYTQEGFYVFDILFVNSSTVLAVTSRLANGISGTSWGDIFRSTDGGNTWQIISPTGFECGNSLAMGYNSTDTVVYAGSGYKDSKGGVLWKSTDLGQTWIAVNVGPSSLNNASVDSLPINDIAVAPGSLDTLYIASGYNKDYAFVVSYDGGQTYHYTNLQGEGAFSAVAINLDNPDSAVYVANRRDVLTYNPSASSYELTLRGLPGELVPDLAHGSILVGTTTGFYGIDGDTDGDIVVYIENKDIQNTPLIIYPNPSTNRIHLMLPSNFTNEIVFVKLYNMLGKVVMQEDIKVSDEYSINCEHLRQGNYFIELIQNETIINAKFVISK